jgi:archaemetzincin
LKSKFRESAATITPAPAPLMRVVCTPYTFHVGAGDTVSTLHLMKRISWLTLYLWLGVMSCSAFEPPSVVDRAKALGPLDDESPVLQRLLTPDDDFAPIHAPRPGDWLAMHAERGQTFSGYCTVGFNRPSRTRHVIYLLPLGEFPADASPPLDELRAYAEAYFQLEVQILPAVPLDEKKFKPRTNEYSQKRQLLSTSILSFLQAQLPSDAYCLLGVTMEDLYPAPSWNFVFGQASLTERVGIYSFARYDPAFFGKNRPDDYRQLILKRSCNVLAHETTHMFGLNHCIFYECLVNGSNSLEEADSCPHHLCPICLRKLHFNVQFDPVTRYEELARFYRRHDWDEEARWTDRQLAKGKDR